jgi:fructose-1,6-bisphosphatase/inositol monophosphatase family enzyme
MDESSLLMITSNLLDKNKRVPGYLMRWFGQTDWKLRILGSAALEAVQVAAGVAHGAITVNGKLWDVAAPAAILQEAGAVLTSLKGEPIFPFEVANYKGAKVPFLAAGPGAHGELLREVRSYS